MFKRFQFSARPHPHPTNFLPPILHRLHCRLKIPVIVSHHRADDNSLLPLILPIHLSYRDVELAMQPRNQRLDVSALFFERGTAWKVEVNSERRNHFIMLNLPSSAARTPPGAGKLSHCFTKFVCQFNGIFFITRIISCKKFQSAFNYIFSAWHDPTVIMWLSFQRDRASSAHLRRYNRREARFLLHYVCGR